jgi:uncharacterized surface protein with fasciclin (FAS1) repeats
MLLSAGFTSVSGQGRTLTDIIDSRSDLSTLAVFLDAADPSVRETLEEGGPYTVFAPTNTAFANLASALEMPLVELLRNPQATTQILQYHVIEGRYNASRMRDLDGQVVPTLLTGAFVGVRVNDDSTISLNNVVEVTEGDVPAVNGVVHIVNDVLLNRVIANTVDSATIERAITPNPGAAALATLPPTPQPTDVVRAVSNLRIAHFSPDTPPVDVYLDDERLVSDVAFGDISDFVSIRPGTYRFSVVESGTSPDDSTLIGPANLTLSDGTFATAAAIGSLDNDTLEGDIITGDYRSLESGQSRLVLYHALEGVPPVQFVQENGEVLVPELAYGDSTVLSLPRGVYRLDVRPAESNSTDSSDNTDNTGDTLLELPPVSLPNGTYQLAALIGSLDEPDVVQTIISGSEAVRLRRGGELADVAPVSATDERPLQDVIDVLLQDDDFTILVAALQNADEDVINRLNSVLLDPITLLAPTDQAFRNLLASTDMSQDELFNNDRLLTDILQYHLVEGAFTVQDFRAANGTSIVTRLDNEAFFVSVNEAGEVRLNRVVEFLETDIRASNGIIHVVDEVLLPPDVVDMLSP